MRRQWKHLAANQKYRRRNSGSHNQQKKTHKERNNKDRTASNVFNADIRDTDTQTKSAQREREPAINVENLDISQEFAKQRWKQPTTIKEEDRGKETHLDNKTEKEKK